MQLVGDKVWVTLNVPMRSGQRIYQKYRENGELVPDVQCGGYKIKSLSGDQFKS